MLRLGHGSAYRLRVDRVEPEHPVKATSMVKRVRKVFISLL